MAAQMQLVLVEMERWAATMAREGVEAVLRGQATPPVTVETGRLAPSLSQSISEADCEIRIDSG